MAALEDGKIPAPTARSGKFRHIYGEPMEKGKCVYEDLRTPQTSGEGNYVAAGRKFIAMAGNSGGGPICVFAHGKPARGLRDRPGISVHKGKVWDFEFSPFYDHVIASGGDDTKAMITKFTADEDGLDKDVTEPMQVFDGHSKKVTHVRFSKVTNVLATASFDATVRVYDIESAASVAEFATKGGIQSMEWNKDSTLIGASSKDKNLYTFDPRAPEAATTITGFAGSKSVKLTFMDRMGWLGACGFDKTAKRQIKIWDLRDTSEALYSQNLDSASSVLVPHWDDDLCVLYTAGKGEGSISYYEVVNDSTKVYYISMYRSKEPQRGGGWTPKSALNVWNCEVQRYYKLTKKSIVPLSFTVPRKAGKDVFQADIFPDAFSHKMALDPADYLSGKNAQPLTMSLDPAKRYDSDAGSGELKVKKSYAELEADHEALKAKYAEVKARLAEKDPSYEPSDDDEKADA